jgi:hypothetical protein
VSSVRLVEILPYFPNFDELIKLNSSVKPYRLIDLGYNVRAIYAVAIELSDSDDMMTYIINERHFLRQAKRFEEEGK